MEIKCDTCICNVLSDERDVGCGYVPFCNKGHWSGEYDNYDDNEEYCTFRDKCIDYKLKKPTGRKF